MYTHISSHKYNFHWFLYIVAVFLMTGCDSEPVPVKEDNLCGDNPAPCELVPLVVGNSWTYDAFIGDSLLVGHHSTKEVLRAENHVINGQDIEMYHVPLVPVELDHLVFAANLEDGLYKFGTIFSEDSAFIVTKSFPFPAEVGATGTLLSWHVDSDPPNEIRVDTIEVTLADLKANVEVPAGQFETIVYHYRFPERDHFELLRGDVYVHFTPRIGIVAIIFRDEVAGEIISQSLLKEYTLK